MTRPLILILTIAATPITAIQQPARDGRGMSAVGTGVISGTVVTSDTTPAPVRRAEVFLYFADGGSRLVVTNDAGAFVFSELPATRFTLSVFKNGYLDVHYGAKRPGEVVGRMSIALAAGQKMTDLKFNMPRGSVITGRVVDLNGEPAARARIQVFKSSFDWRTGLRQFQIQNGGEADERGIYRIYGLPPGDYIVSASTTDDRTDFRVPTSSEWQWVDAQLRLATPGAQSGSDAPPAGSTMAYAPVFFPRTPVQTNAGVIKLGLAEERAGIDIQLDLVPTARIDGRLTTSSDSATANAPVLLLRRGEGGTGTIPINQVTSDPEGKFSFTGVAPGSYLIYSRPGSPQTFTTAWALAELNVAGKDQIVALNLQPGLSVTGQIVFDRGTTSVPPSDLTRVRVQLVPMAVGGTPLSNPAMLSSTAVVDATGHFTFGDVSPGQYRVQTSAPSGATAAAWSLRSAVAGGVDAVDSIIDIKPGDSIDFKVTFTDRQTELTGMLQTASGRPAPDYFIILFPAEERLWLPQSRRIRVLRPDNEGKYRAQNLPAGEYLLSAVTDVAQFEWFDPAYLAQLKPLAIRLTIAEGDRKAQDLRIGGSH